MRFPAILGLLSVAVALPSALKNDAQAATPKSPSAAPSSVLYLTKNKSVMTSVGESKFEGKRGKKAGSMGEGVHQTQFSMTFSYRTKYLELSGLVSSIVV